MIRDRTMYLRALIPLISELSLLLQGLFRSNLIMLKIEGLEGFIEVRIRRTIILIMNNLWSTVNEHYILSTADNATEQIHVGLHQGRTVDRISIGLSSSE